MSDFAVFGDPSRFEIALRWQRDLEPRACRPAHGGWSTGEFRLTVGRQVLTRHVQACETQEAARWYLLPLFEWLAANWVQLLHEERFSWRENGAAPAAPTVSTALNRWIDAVDPGGRQTYRGAHSWWSRHALRAADSSALYPDVVFRRLGEDVEISWTARQPAHAPDGFRLDLVPGAACLPMADVARPLWEALAWAVSTAHPDPLDQADRSSVAELELAISRLHGLSVADLEDVCLPAALLLKARRAETAASLPATSVRMSETPALTRLDDAVLMFGGVSPEIGSADARSLTTFMGAHRGGRDSDAIAVFVRNDVGPPLTAPHEEGAELALELLDKLEQPRPGASSIDIDEIVSRLGISVQQKPLDTDTIRGAAIAGEGYEPAILINLRSHYNGSEAGRRFTLAHELFHILYDRTRARRVAHSSGPWAPAGVEKRANAFAAMILMPRDLIQHVGGFGPWTRPAISLTADRMRVGASALVEHLYNIEMIDEYERDRLRAEFRNPPSVPRRPSSGPARRASRSRS